MATSGLMQSRRHGRSCSSERSRIVPGTPVILYLSFPFKIRRMTTIQFVQVCYSVFVLVGPESPFQLSTARGLKSKDICFWQKYLGIKLVKKWKPIYLKNLGRKETNDNLFLCFCFLFFALPKSLCAFKWCVMDKNSATNWTSQGMELWHQEAVASQSGITIWT